MRDPDPIQRLLRSYYQKELNAIRLLSPEELARSAVVFAPHPDDESLACGGTILQKKQAGAAMKVVFMTDGSASHTSFMPAEQMREIRMEEARAACAKLGLGSEDVVFLDFRDQYLNTCQAEATQKAFALLKAFQPDEVFIPLHDDPQPDHRATHSIVSEAAAHLDRPITINAFPVWYWFHWPWIMLRQGRRSDTLWAIKRTLRTGFGVRMLGRFNASVNIRDVLESKRAALNEHRSQMTQLLPNQNWLTLEGMSQGEFLARFFQDREYFYRYAVNSLPTEAGSNPTKK